MFKFPPVVLLSNVLYLQEEPQGIRSFCCSCCFVRYPTDTIIFHYYYHKKSLTKTHECSSSMPKYMVEIAVTQKSRV